MEINQNHLLLSCLTVYELVLKAAKGAVFPTAVGKFVFCM